MNQNNMINNIVKWNVDIENFPNEISVEGLYDDYEGFRILVRGVKPSTMYRINFGTNYLGYRNFDESERLKLVDLLPSNCREWCLFKSNKSDLIDWVVNQSEGIQQKEDLIHFYIVTQFDVIDIICLKEPKVEEL